MELIKTKNKQVTTYHPDVVNRNITRWDLKDHENWSEGDIINVTIKEWSGHRYFISKIKMKLKRFIGVDDRPSGLIPNSEKAWSNTQKKLVPNRYIWEVEWIVNKHSFF